MITTTTDYFASTDNFEVFSDATMIDRADRFEDCLAEPIERNRELMSLLAPSAITIPPSDLPAYELPDYEPTSADLLAIETAGEHGINTRIASANTLSAFEARHRELQRLRADLPAFPAADEDDLERVA